MHNGKFGFIITDKKSALADKDNWFMKPRVENISEANTGQHDISFIWSWILLVHGKRKKHAENIRGVLLLKLLLCAPVRKHRQITNHYLPLPTEGIDFVSEWKSETTSMENARSSLSQRYLGKAIWKKSDFCISAK